MFHLYLVFCAILMLVRCQYDAVSNVLENTNTPIKVVEADVTDKKFSSEKVTLKLFYESLCPDCVEFDPTFERVALELLQYVDVYTYPYGNARMTKNQDGSVDVECQHGEPECYGNKLHACAIDVLKDLKLYLEYNGCMIAQRSNDTAADKCGKNMKIPVKKVEVIKKCAKSARGQELLVFYGEESEKANFPYVPYVLINEAVWNGEAGDFKKDVCAAFTSAPAPCLD